MQVKRVIQRSERFFIYFVMELLMLISQLVLRKAHSFMCDTLIPHFFTSICAILVGHAHFVVSETD
ncbi:hypothetical protein BX666DRAFT_1184553 [Dichotomocladium elegans]|nr:hypothetical protein BX666DRAFT_1184553 [Dichotomocladium elegans]